MCIRAFQIEVVERLKRKKKLYQAKCILRDFCSFLLVCIRTFQKASVLRDLNIFKSQFKLRTQQHEGVKELQLSLKVFH